LNASPFTEIWRSSFVPSEKNKLNSVDIDGLKDKLDDGRWIYIRDSNGAVIGRYAVLIEDENSKININSSSAISTKNQNQGVGTFEIMLRQMLTIILQNQNFNRMKSIMTLTVSLMNRMKE